MTTKTPDNDLQRSAAEEFRSGFVSAQGPDAENKLESVSAAAEGKKLR